MPIDLSHDTVTDYALYAFADVQTQVSAHAQRYHDAAMRAGLTEKQYRELATEIDASKGQWGPLPRHVDNMVFRRGGKLYAIRNFTTPAGEWGWRMDLPGKSVWIAQRCGNFSVVSRPVAIAHHAVHIPARHSHYVAPARIVNAPPVVSPLFVSPSAPPAVALVPPAPVHVTAPAAAAVSHGNLWALVLPFVGGVLSSVGGGGGQPLVVPPCSMGSNDMGVCHAGSSYGYYPQ